MIHFKVSAPCRLSLFGELALKYGKTSLIAAMDLRTTLTFNEVLTLASERCLYLNFHKTNLVREFVGKFQNFYSECTENLILLRERILQYTDHLPDTPKTKIVQAFYYLLVFITYKEQIEIKPFTMDLSTELMMDDELACPASYTVCLAASLIHWSRLQKGIHDTFDQNDIRKILKYAARCEGIFSESELINVTTCTYGSITKKNMDKINYTIDVISYNILMPILLVDSKQTQNLEAQMQRIAKFNTHTSPEFVSSIFKSIDILTKNAYNNFRSFIDIYKDNNIDIETRRTRILQKNYELKLYIRSSQNLLQSLNVSHDLLDYICLIARKHEMCAKYTDIGNGRYAYIWCPCRYVGEACTHMTLISEELKTHGFDVTETNLAWSGVRIEMP